MTSFFGLCLTLDTSDVKDKKYVCLCFLFSLQFSDRHHPQVLEDLPHMSQEIEILSLIINTLLAICNRNPKSIYGTHSVSLKHHGFLQLRK